MRNENIGEHVKTKNIAQQILSCAGLINEIVKPNFL